MNSKISEKDKKIWNEFLSSDQKLPIKDEFQAEIKAKKTELEKVMYFSSLIREQIMSNWIEPKSSKVGLKAEFIIFLSLMKSIIKPFPILIGFVYSPILILFNSFLLIPIFLVKKKCDWSGNNLDNKGVI